MHALRRLKLRNLTDERLVVRLRSNLGAQMAFQLSNENMTDFQRLHSPQARDMTAFLKGWWFDGFLI
jgi:hypothetical protein